MRVSRAGSALRLALVAAALVVGVSAARAANFALVAPASGAPRAAATAVAVGAIATARTGTPLEATSGASARTGRVGRQVFDLGHGVLVYAYWTPGARNVPSVLMVHGGSWEHGTPAAPYYLSWAEREQARGWAAFSIGYRLLPSVVWPAPVEDVQRGLRWIRAHADRFGLDLGRSFLVGHSSGGQLATIAGLQMGGFAGVASISGATDPLAEYRAAPDHNLRRAAALLVGGRVHDRALWESTRAVNYLGPHVMPFLVMQSVDDPIVPFSTGRAFARALLEHGYPTTTIEVPGDVHSLTTFDNLSTIDRWMDSVLISSEQRQLTDVGAAGDQPR